MTSYQDFARIVADALRGRPNVAGAIATARNEIVVELRGGDTFMLSAMLLPPSELARLNIAREAA